MTKDNLSINICTAFDGWILSQIATNWAKHIPNCKASDRPDVSADVNFYVNYHLFHAFGYRKTNYDIGFFTHKEPLRPYDEVAKSVDHCIGMSTYAYKLLPKNKRSLISPIGPDRNLFKGKELTLGVVAKNQPGGRKGFEILDELNSIKGVNIKLTGGRLSKEQLLEFYSSIDYVLVTSKIEGGPIPVLESLLLNKPVIAPDVGWCWEFPVIKYSSFDELKSIVSKLASPIISWEESSKEIYSIITKCLKSQ